MGYENVKLWFARDENGEIVTIDEVKEIHSTYNCPVCGSSLLPKATESKKVTPHFAHVDASKCNTESHVHWWFKHRLIVPGDQFKVVSDKERTYICKEILVEQSYPTSFGEYRPDVTVVTETGETIYFEMAFSNKKKRKDYHDLWLELNNIVIEVDLSQIIKFNYLPTFRALFYKGMSYNISKTDTYYHTIGILKETCSVDVNKRNKIKRLDWFWSDLTKYKKGIISKDDLFLTIDALQAEDFELVRKILTKNKCNVNWQDYITYKVNKTKRKIEASISKYTQKKLYTLKVSYKEKNKKVIDADIICKSALEFLPTRTFNIFRYDDFIDIFSVDLKDIDKTINNNEDIELKADQKIKILNDFLISNSLTEIFYINKNYKYNDSNKLSVFIRFNYIGRRAMASFNFQYSANNSIEEFKNKIELNVWKIQEKLRRLEIWDHAVNSTALTSAFHNIGVHFREFDKNYKIYLNKQLEGSVYIPRVDIYYSQEGLLGSFNLHDEIVYSDNYNEIYSYLNLKIGERLTEEKCLLYKEEIMRGILKLTAMYNGDIMKIGVKEQRDIIILTFVYHNNKLNEYYINMNSSPQIKDNAYDFFKQEMLKLVRKKSIKSCKDCDSNLKLSDGEVLFFLEKDLNMPKRCKKCRKKKSGGSK